MKKSYKIQLFLAALVSIITIVLDYMSIFHDDSYIYTWWSSKPILIFTLVYLFLQDGKFYKISKYKHKSVLIAILVILLIIGAMSTASRENFVTRAFENPVTAFVFQISFPILYFCLFLLSYFQEKREIELQE